MKTATDDDDENESMTTVPAMAIEPVVPVIKGVIVSVDLASLRPDISRVILLMVIIYVVCFIIALLGQGYFLFSPSIPKIQKMRTISDYPMSKSGYM